MAIGSGRVGLGHGSNMSYFKNGLNCWFVRVKFRVFELLWVKFNDNLPILMVLMEIDSNRNMSMQEVT